MRSRTAGVKNRLKAKLYAAGPGQVYGPAFRKLASGLSGQEAPFLDVGCGNGGLVAAISDRFPDCRVVGIDRNPAAAEDAAVRARGVGSAAILAMDAQRMSFPSESFRTVFALQNLMHWKSPDMVLGEILRVLEPGGELRIYQAGGGDVPADWLHRPLGWPTDRILRLRWKRYQPPEEFLRTLPRRMLAVGFSTVQRTHEGFYRKWVAKK